MTDTNQIKLKKFAKQGFTPPREKQTQVSLNYQFQNKNLSYMKISRVLILVFVVATTISNANAFFFFFPIPNFAKPPALQKIIDALEKSTDTKAVAYASEDKTFGSKQWTWGQMSGVMTQEEANSKAMKICDEALQKLKAQTVGGQPLYNFGGKTCELHKFSNETVNSPIKEPVATTNQLQPGTDTNENQIAKKLKELDSLLQQNLISKEEYETKRKEILNKL